MCSPCCFPCGPCCPRDPYRSLSECYPKCLIDGLSPITPPRFKKEARKKQSICRMKYVYKFQLPPEPARGKFPAKPVYRRDGMQEYAQNLQNFSSEFNISHNGLQSYSTSRLEGGSDGYGGHPHYFMKTHGQCDSLHNRGMHPGGSASFHESYRKRDGLTDGECGPYRWLPSQNDNKSDGLGEHGSGSSNQRYLKRPNPDKRDGLGESGCEATTTRRLLVKEYYDKRDGLGEGGCGPSQSRRLLLNRTHDKRDGLQTYPKC